VRTTINQGEVIPVSPDVVVETQQRQRIGTILVQAGHLTLETAERILKLQHQTGLRFGEAGIQLGLLTQDDVDFALARQFDCPYLTPGTSKVSEKVAAGRWARCAANSCCSGSIAIPPTRRSPSSAPSVAKAAAS
jgi:hypothetical protein